MPESSATIAELRRLAQGPGTRPTAVGPAGAWLTSGLPAGQLHELFVARAEEAASGAGFAVALALTAQAMPLMWLRTEEGERAGGRIHAGGLAELGTVPAELLVTIASDEAALLRAAGDAARCHGLGTLLLELRGRADGLDLTASRRLMLAAEASGVTVLCLRIDAQPLPSAAASRWRIAAAASAALEAGAPGGPAFDVECLRRRGAPAGERWRIEWNRDARIFVPLDSAPLSGAGLPMAAGGAVARHPPPPLRRSG